VNSLKEKFYFGGGKNFLLVIPDLSFQNPHEKFFREGCFYTRLIIHTVLIWRTNTLPSVTLLWITVVFLWIKRFI